MRFFFCARIRCLAQKAKVKCHKKPKRNATKSKSKLSQKTKIIWHFESHLSHYRDRYGLESDLVLHLGDGRYALIECKLGSREIEDGASHLVELRDLIREYNKKEKQVPLREPDLMIVVTGGKMAYTRPDGVKIIPLACFKD
jgi:hypothetical protein